MRLLLLLLLPLPPLPQQQWQHCWRQSLPFPVLVLSRANQPLLVPPLLVLLQHLPTSLQLQLKETLVPLVGTVTPAASTTVARSIATSWPSSSSASPVPVSALGASSVRRSAVALPGCASGTPFEPGSPPSGTSFRGMSTDLL